MNKMKEYERGREDGLDLALRIVRDGGIEALEREIKFRGSFVIKDAKEYSIQTSLNFLYFISLLANFFIGNLDNGTSF